MRNSFSKTCRLGVFVVVMNRVVIAGHTREEEKVSICHRLCGYMKSLTKVKVFEIFRCGEHGVSPKRGTCCVKRGQGRGKGNAPRSLYHGSFFLIQHGNGINFDQR